MGMVATLVMWHTQVEQFLSPDHKGVTWNFTLIYPAVGSRSLKVYICMTMDKGQTMTLTSGIENYSCPRLVNYL